jgi:hypothetical protein
MLAPGLSVPEKAVLRAQAEAALRDFADAVSQGLPDPWPAQARHAALDQLDALPSALGAAVASTDLHLAQRPGWWQRVAVVQFALFGVAGAGLAWLVAVPALRLSVVSIGPVPGAALTLAAALLAGLALWAVTWALAGSIGRSVRSRTEAALTEAVTAVAEERVLAPVKAELRVYSENRIALATLSTH